MYIYINKCYNSNTMYSISQALDDIIMSKPYFSELLERDLLNITQLARQLRPEIEDRCMKKTSVEAIAMAIRRAPKPRPSPKLSDFFKQSPDIMVRSQLCELTVKRHANLNKIHKLLDKSAALEGQFFTITQGIFEDTIIVSRQFRSQVIQLFGKEDIIAEFDNLAAVTVRLKPAIVSTPGVYHLILKSLFLEGINVVEVVSTYLEFSILVEEKNTEHTFSTVKKLFTQPSHRR